MKNTHCMRINPVCIVGCLEGTVTPLRAVERLAISQ